MRPITERLSPLIKGLVIASTLVFAFYALVPQARGFITEHLVLGPNLLRGEVWQLVTTLFVHLDPLSFFFDMLGLWFVGATIERLLGRKRFLMLLLIPQIAANLAVLGVGLLMGQMATLPGCGLAILGLFVAFGKHFGRTPARVLGGLVLEARVLALVLVGFAILVDAARGAVASLAGDLVAVGLAYALSPGDAGLSDLFRRFGRGGGGGGGSKKSRRFEVIEGGRRDRGSRPGTAASDDEDERPRYLN